MLGSVIRHSMSFVIRIRVSLASVKVAGVAECSLIKLRRSNYLCSLTAVGRIGRGPYRPWSVERDVWRSSGGEHLDLTSLKR